ncbi:hypothetical protein [Amycolatopsis jiangsuensis]|uniref:Secreted protein n=1 Tax=Amycolatopsis jiangsuensis TaxID=1181879 RepID=A0A840J7X9_9PSEU|nr:hypothetical protein [Amycolatopsis jiangsuensis]MBB4689715.1 hypothetical protein [Amycolatopsis jiangsuensis]
MGPKTRRVVRAVAIATVPVFSVLFGSAAAAPAGPPSAAPSSEAPPPAVAAAGIPASYYVRDTVSHIAKLQSDLALTDGTFDANVDAATASLSGTLSLPPTPDAYFVAFRFMPATSTVELVPDGPQGGLLLKNPGDAGEVAQRPFPDGNSYLSVIADLTLRVDIRLSEATVDGRVLDLGEDCRTAAPVEIRLKGVIGLQPTAPPTKMTTTFAIPPFSGCRGHENLDRLITGLVSGPGNTLNTTIAVRCVGTCEADAAR